MNKIFWLLLLSAATGCAVAPRLDKQVTETEVQRIIGTLAADDMEGRATFTPGIEKAADFIAAEFRKIGLEQLEGVTGYKQSFEMLKPSVVSATATVDGQNIDSKSIVAFSTNTEIDLNAASGYRKVHIAKGSNIGAEIGQYFEPTENTVVFIDTSFSRVFRRLGGFMSYTFPRKHNVVFVLTASPADSYDIKVRQQVTPVVAHNIVGVLPGKFKRDEQVIFSGHYDHIGIGKPVNGDSIYNGANDDASGITGVIMAAKYFKRARNNERTLVFAAFTAEEMGGYGSKYFSQQLNPAKVMAMFNLEMIGTDSKWGKNSAYITGFDETDMGKILQKNLEGSAFTFHPDPYPAQQLFYRSDNATLARLGVPAHTISTSKMDSEPNYHKVTDEVGTLDLQNMTAIIKAIITSSASIIKGTDTPTRVNAANLKR
ncbi:M20/M25/M40 family metallo-hydrolase [Aridibaculum aurantiacum]|uniref:M20/M25/M40 family metallo-hydrolase n=1 Tax=Aridibaculum aurantiacum TaxID=2810307 RepID=UPI001A96E114|nr:M20/M25/M40 family metallo-hydrolase [Aridibaculum aurantiacum]